MTDPDIIELMMRTAAPGVGRELIDRDGDTPMVRSMMRDILAALRKAGVAHNAL